jgi:peptide deformylase
MISHSLFFGVNMEDTKLKDAISVNSFGIKGEDVVDSVEMKEKEAELKEQLSEEDMKVLQDEFKKEVERLEAKYDIVDANIAETIEVEDVDPIEAMRIIEEKEDLYAFTEMRDGLGLSASQMGIGKKWFVARDMSAEDNPFKVYFNPKYFPNGSTRITFKEGCLTYPGEQVDIKRWKNITFHWYGFDQNGEWKKFKKNVKGLNSIILQHETDHCAGYPGGTNKPRTIMAKRKGRK